MKKEKERERERERKKERERENAIEYVNARRSSLFKN